MNRTVSELLALAANHPCWRLRITPAEHDTLGLAFASERNYQRRAKLAVLIASSVIRVGFAGGAWSWDPVAAALGWTDGKVALSVLIGDGLDYLAKTVPIGAGGQRLVLSGARIQAGLPTQMLADQGGLLFRWSSNVLEHLQDYGVTGTGTDDTATAVRIAIDNAPQGPAWTRDEGVAALVGELTLSLWRLTRVPGAPDGNATALLTWLAHHLPNWRETLPVDLTDASAVAAITALLGTAQAVARPVARPYLRLTLTAGTAPGEFDVLRSLVLPTFLPVDMLADLFGPPPDSMPRGTVFLCTSGKDHCTARLYRGAGGFKVDREPDGLRGNGPLRVELRGWGALRIAPGLANTEPLPQDLPWVFDELGGEWRLVALGSVRRREALLRVALPPGAQTQGIVTVIGTVLGRDLVQISAQVSIVTAGARYVVVAGSPQQDEGGALVARGSRHPQSPEDRDVFLGVPNVVWESETGAIITVPDAEVMHRFRGPHQAWSNGFPGPGTAGTATLRWTRGGVVRGEKSLTWLPVGSVIKTFAQTDTGGTLHPTGAITLVGVVNPVGFQIAQVNGNAVLTLQGNAAPIWVTTQAMLPGGDHVALRVPFPIRRRIFFDRNGHPVTGVVSLDSLRGIRVHLQEMGAHGAEMRLRLYAGVVPTGHEDHVRLMDEQPGTYGLDLSAIEAPVNRLLALDQDIKVYVEVSVTPLTFPQPGGPCLQIRPYTKDIQREADGSDVVLFTPELSLELDGEYPSVQIEASRLDGVGTEPLTRLHPGHRWVVPVSNMNEGTWLITATVRREEAAQPLLWQRPLPANPCGLAAACGERDFPIRQDRIGAAVQQIEAALGAPALRVLPEVAIDLNLIRQHFGLLERTAARGLDVLRAVSTCPTIAAYFLLEVAHDSFRVRRVWDQLQTLPFLWALVPRAAWQNAMALYRDSRKDKALRLDFEKRGFEGVVALYPAFEIILADWRSDLPALPLPQPLQDHYRGELSRDITCERAGAGVVDGVVPRSGLLQRHAGVDLNQWPHVHLPPRPGGPNVRLPGHNNFHAPTLTAPWLVADRVWNNHCHDLSPADIGQIREVRDFDPEWFDNALKLALSQHLFGLPPVIS